MGDPRIQWIRCRLTLQSYIKIKLIGIDTIHEPKFDNGILTIVDGLHKIRIRKITVEPVHFRSITQANKLGRHHLLQHIDK